MSRLRRLRRRGDATDGIGEPKVSMSMRLPNSAPIAEGATGPLRFSSDRRPSTSTP